LMLTGLAHADLAKNQEFIESKLAELNAQLVTSQNQLKAIKTYPLSYLQRVSNQVRAKDELELQGIWQSFTYELSIKHKLSNVVREVLINFYHQNGQILTWCENRECGSSALWANYVFNQPRLNGLDDAQIYAVIMVKNEDQNTFTVIVMYAIKRGNQKSYVHFEVIEPSDSSLNSFLAKLTPNAGALLKALRVFGADANFQLPVVVSESWLNAVSGMLEIDSTIHLEITGFGANLWRTNLEGVSKHISRISFIEENQSDEKSLVIKIK